jgi:2-polyprenyl-3-methyl-5-hydroxy-6-metoxy-1,4-benzoquinol methylase
MDPENLPPSIIDRLLSVFRRRGPRESPLTREEQALLNIKFFGYELARSLADALPPRSHLAPCVARLGWKPSTQRDLESDWLAYWAGQLAIPVVFHRKLWELCYVLQVLWERGLIAPGRRGLGFGCGREPIASLLAARGVSVTATDLSPEDAKAKGWIETAQHAGSADYLYFSELCARSDFDRLVSWRSVDMNAIPSDLSGYDFCWSICAFEHLGSIENGLRFVERAMAALKPGGVAIHTTEFNFLYDHETLTKGATVLFLRRHFEELHRRLRDAGHEVEPLDFDVGNKPLDKFIDVPPFPIGRRAHLFRAWPESYHIKVACEGYPTTCYGLIVRKKSEMPLDGGAASGCA